MKFLCIAVMTVLLSCGSNGGSGGGGGGSRGSLVKPVLTNEITQETVKANILGAYDNLSNIELGMTFTKVFDCQMAAPGQSARSYRELIYKLIDFEANTGKLKFLVEVKTNNDPYECLSELYTSGKHYIVNTTMPSENDLDFYLAGYKSFYSGRLQNRIPVVVMKTSETQDGVKFDSEFGLLLDRPMPMAFYNELDMIFVSENVQVTIQSYSEQRGSILDMDTSLLPEFNEDFFKAN